MEEKSASTKELLFVFLVILLFVLVCIIFVRTFFFTPEQASTIISPQSPTTMLTPTTYQNPFSQDTTTDGLDESTTYQNPFESEETLSTILSPTPNDEPYTNPFEDL